MTVSTSSNKNGPYVLNGVTTVFSRTFLLLDAAHIRLVRTFNGVQSDIVSGFVVDGVGSATGNVTISPALNGGTVTLVRKVPQSQQTNYSNQAKVAPKQVERDLDLVVMQIQDLQGAVNADLNIIAAQDAATQAALYDGPKVETWTELQALTPSIVNIGQLITRRDINQNYEVVSTGEHFTTTGGLKVKVLAPTSGKVSVRAFGAVLDAVADDTAAFQIAVNSGLAIGPEKGVMLLTDTILVEEKTFIDFEGGATLNTQANFQIKFTPATKRDMYNWRVAPSGSEYRFGTVIRGFAVQGFGPGIDAVFDLPNSYGCKYTANAYSGFDKFARISKNIDTVYEGSAQGCRVYGSHWINDFGVSSGVSTTTTFNVYVSGAPIGHYFDDFSASGCTIAGITESCVMAAKGATGNIIRWASYIENCPSVDAATNCIEWGLFGASAVYDTRIVFADGIYYGTNAGAVLTRFIECGTVDALVFEGGTFKRFGSLVKTSVNTRNLVIDPISMAGVPVLAKPGDIYNMSKSTILGVRPYFGALTVTGDYTEFGLASGGLQLFPATRVGAFKGQIFRENTSDRFVLRRDDGSYSAHFPPMSTTQLSAWTFGTKTVPNEIVVHGANGNGLPASWRASRHGTDTGVIVAAATTTNASATINKSAGAFSGLDVTDHVTVSAGMPSATAQYQVIAVAGDGSNITLDTNATSTVTGTVTVARLVHDLQPIGQQGWRSGAATPVGAITPQFIGERYLDTSGGKKFWTSIGLTTADWA